MFHYMLKFLLKSELCTIHNQSYLDEFEHDLVNLSLEYDEYVYCSNH